MAKKGRDFGFNRFATASHKVLAPVIYNWNSQINHLPPSHDGFRKLMTLFPGKMMEIITQCIYST